MVKGIAQATAIKGIAAAGGSIQIKALAALLLIKRERKRARFFGGCLVDPAARLRP